MPPVKPGAGVEQALLPPVSDRAAVATGAAHGFEPGVQFRHRGVEWSVVRSPYVVRSLLQLTIDHGQRILSSCHSSGSLRAISSATVESIASGPSAQ